MRKVTGATHNAELKPGVYYVGTTVPLERGYNKPCAQWSKEAKVTYGR